MKKSITVLVAILWAMFVLNPLCQVIGLLSGMQFTLKSEMVFLIGTAGITVLVSASLLKERVLLDGPGIALAVMLPVVCALNGMYTALASDNNLVLLFILIAQTGTIVILVRTMKPGAAKIAAVTVSIVMSVILLFVLSFDFLFSSVGRETTVNEIVSPSGIRAARVIEREKDELSEGAVYVDVEDKAVTDILIGEYRRIPARLFTGEAGQGETLELSWVDDDTLLIDGTAYEVETAGVQ